MAACPVGSLTSFPLGIDFTPTYDIYKNLSRDTASIQVQWGSRATKPGFLLGSNNGGLIDEQSGMTTLRYNSMTYNLITVQIAKATHTPWMLPISAQPDNKEDIIFIFTTTARSTTPIIMIIVPIVRDGTAQSDPMYLTALNSDGDAGSGPYSLDKCMPFNDYVKYTTCLNGYSTEAPTANAIVFVAVEGLKVSPTLMAAIQEGFGGNPFPAPTSDFMTKFTVSRFAVTPATIGTKVSISSPFSIYVAPSDAPPTTDNYKCMPLDMAQIQTSDLSGAKTLTQILLPEQQDIKLVNPGKLEKGISIALGIIMGAAFFGLGIYMLWTLIQGTRAAAATVSGATPTVTIFSKLYSLWPFILVLAVGIAAGAVITFLSVSRDPPKD